MRPPTSLRFNLTQTKALAGYLDYVLRVFELGDWRVHFVDEQPEGPSGDNAATVTVIYGRRVAELRLMNRFFDEPVEKIEHYLIHEMCHLFSEGLDSVRANGPALIMGASAAQIFDEQFRVQLELMTDKLAYVLHDLLHGAEYKRLRKALKP